MTDSTHIPLGAQLPHGVRPIALRKVLPGYGF